MESFTDESNSVSNIPRPQSVAQRILRERQERNITAKVPETPENNNNNNPKTKSSKKNNKSRQPLYLALKATAQKNKQTSKSELAEKIKQEAILTAAETYRVPPLPNEFYENMKRLQNNSFLKDKDERVTPKADDGERRLSLIDETMPNF